MAKNNKLKRGFAKLAQEDPDRLSQIASEGGRRAHETGKANEFNSETGREAGRLGGEARARNMRNKKNNQGKDGGGRGKEDDQRNQR